MQAIKTGAAAALVVAGVLALSAAGADDNSNVAIVNGVPIPKERLDYVVQSQVQQGQKDDENLRKNVKDALIMREVIAQEAIKKGLDKEAQFQTQMAMAKQEFLIRAYFDDFLKSNPITDEQLKAEYEKIKAQQTGGGERKEYKARHILIKNEKQAKSVLAQINKASAKNFAQLAKAKSEDSGSKNDGGALDWSDGSNFVKEFSEAMMKLKKGEWTHNLVKTQYGYHIIMVDDIRDIQFPEFDQVKERLQQQMLSQRRDKAIAALKETAKVE
jgi:peptidyl-prolyl cis-trans isomerase C